MMSSQLPYPEGEIIGDAGPDQGADCRPQVDDGRVNSAVTEPTLT
jgi:hypothetical protein